ncbi:DNA polymerase Y family protein [Ottowia beijingensis]|uniref:DNA polymerase Y family protein n=1 Tax=Ottowia beijingensis TaxID=1207057 RepID=A0A853IY59_9BURK|nr:DNA polymerase Y family protein [Ottowia beijingensis]NZA02960.1 DNA polymerase Y family protein [Ottowia beijingensis]
MHWIALQWPPEGSVAGDGLPAAAAPPVGAAPTREALGWWALQFTPHVAWVDEALLLEVSASLRLWGGLKALMRRINESNPAPAVVQQAQEATGLVAIALLRLRSGRQALPADRPAALPLATLTAAQPHLPLFARLGCRTWGDVHALPRAPMVRRFGAELRRALDIAWGLAPESYPWLTLPERFDQRLELPQRADDAPALMWSANRLLTLLQLWLRARQLGVLAFELEWTLDLKRLDGRALPPTQSLVIGTAEPGQAMVHLRRLLAERLAHVSLLAPANGLRLRSLDTAPWVAPTVSFLPEDQRSGDPLHVFIERVSARLGVGSVQAPVLQADHRPECMQGWQAAELAGRRRRPVPRRRSDPESGPRTWLLPRWGRPGWGQPRQPCHRRQPLTPALSPKGRGRKLIRCRTGAHCPLSPAAEGWGEGKATKDAQPFLNQISL